MRRFLKLGSMTLLAALVVGAGILVLANDHAARRRTHPLAADTLAEADRSELESFFRLRAAVGDSVWPGLATAPIPVVLYNDKFEFLAGASVPVAPWKAATGESVGGEPVYRRPVEDPQAFAIPVGDGWGASLFTCERLNRESLLGMRRALPGPLAAVFPYWFVTYGRDFHQALLLHECLHAYQAIRAPERFADAQRAYRYEAAYPSADPAFAAAWTQEGRLLAQALNARDVTRLRDLAAEFLRVRAERRRAARLTPEQIDYEREMEWLEGPAKYAEMRFYELAAASEGGGFRRGLPYWRDDLRRLRTKLGALPGDQRFYLSGMAQAELLDRLGARWKDRLLAGDVHLEELLHDACNAVRDESAAIR